MTRFAASTMVLMVACSSGRPGTSDKHESLAPATTPGPVTAQRAGTEPNAVLDIADPEAAKAAVGRRVRVKGIAGRTKLGDEVSSKTFSVTCMAPRFPDARIDHTVVVEGVLERTDMFQATEEDGAISQGTAPGTSLYIINTCTLL